MSAPIFIEHCLSREMRNPASSGEIWHETRDCAARFLGGDEGTETVRMMRSTSVYPTVISRKRTAVQIIANRLVTAFAMAGTRRLRG
jgi:hypothetical protein